MAAANGRFVSLLRQGWNEIPEILVAGAVATITTAMSAYGMRCYYKNDMFNKKYKLYPVYMRPDDPRVAKVHKA